MTTADYVALAVCIGWLVVAAVIVWRYRWASRPLPPQPHAPPSSPAPDARCLDCGTVYFIAMGPLSISGDGFYGGTNGHCHDDRCLVAELTCRNGHTNRYSVLMTCPVCDWHGKFECACHVGPKIREFPATATRKI